MANNYQAATELQKSGWSIYPLSPGTKIPIKGSSGWNDATNDSNQINEWWTEDATRNIGLMLEDHQMVVVDLDQHSETRNGVENYKNLLQCMIHFLLLIRKSHQVKESISSLKFLMV